MKADASEIRTALQNNPFCILGVTTRDNRQKIVELAEEKSLVLDSDICTKARSELTTPRNRITVEMAWLPGVSPKRAATLVDSLHTHIDLLKGETSIPVLANANLLAAAFELLDPGMDAKLWCEWIVDFGCTVDAIDPEDVLREINEDRSVSGFPEVKGVEQIEVELRERRRYYTDTIKAALDGLDSMKLVEVVTAVVEQTTGSGEDHAPQLVHELVDRYETEANRYLQPEAENIKKLIDAIREAAAKSRAAAKPLVERLEQMARKWDTIAQPIQLSMKAQGRDHDLSHDVAWGMRALAVDLFKKHDMLDIVTRMNKTMQELFAELPVVVERLDQDSEALEGIYENRKKSEQHNAEWARAITYQAEIGWIFKDTLRISPNGVEWKGRRIALDAITRVRWGAVRNGSNKWPTDMDYTIAVGDNRSEIVIDLKKREINDAFLESLWKAVCVRLLTETLKALKSGKQLSFGQALIDDNGVRLPRHVCLASDPVLIDAPDVMAELEKMQKHFQKLYYPESEDAYLKWGDVTYGSANGSFVITAKDDKKTYADIPYLTTPNAHILESIIHLSFKKWKGKLSGLLDDD